MKNNLEFYQHYASADQHPKFKMLRVKYGWSGEGKFWALNNRIAQAENCCLDVSKKYNKAALASDLDFNMEEFEWFIKYLLKDCELVRECEPGVITTDILQENIAKVTVERASARERSRKRWEKTRGSSGEDSKCSGEDSSKGKESKVKETPLPPNGENQKVVNFKPTAEKIYSAYILEIKPSRKSKKRAVDNIATWLGRGRTDSDLVSAIQNYSKIMSEDPKYRKDPANFYGINEDFAFDYLPQNVETPSEIIPIRKTITEREQEERELFANRSMK